MGIARQLWIRALSPTEQVVGVASYDIGLVAHKHNRPALNLVYACQEVEPRFSVSGFYQTGVNLSTLSFFHTSYDSFGNIVSVLDPSFIQPYTYTAREYDPESGMYFYRTRNYDPKIGRFISEDPIGLLGGINFYSYVGNNPVNDIDPLGLYGTKDCSYYKQACEINGGFYECHMAETACNFFPKKMTPQTAFGSAYRKKIRIVSQKGNVVKKAKLV